MLSLTDYERTGGIEGSIAASADRAYAGLTPAQQAAAQPTFMRLVTTSSDLVVSAGRAIRSELAVGTGADVDPRDVTAVMEAFAAQRLLTVGEDYVEISHEVLLTAWGRFRDWLDGDRVDMARYSQLATDATDWDARGRSGNYLYLPGRLVEVSAAQRRWAAAPNRFPPLAAVTVAFLDAARRAARRGRRLRRGGIALLCALVLIAGGAGAFGLVQAGNANRQHASALSRQLAAASLGATDLVTARQLAVAAWRVAPTSQAATAMSTLLAQQDQHGELPVTGTASNTGVSAVAFSADGTLLAAGSTGGDVRLWDPATGKPVGGPLPVGGNGGGGVTSVGVQPGRDALGRRRRN